VHRGVDKDGKVFLSVVDKEMVAGEDNQVYEETKDEFAKMEMDKFNPNTFTSKGTAIFSTHQPEQIIAQLSDALSNMEIDYKMNDKKWKVVLTMKKK
jgi:hypothetical protein